MLLLASHSVSGSSDTTISRLQDSPLAGTAVAMIITQILHAEGEKVEMLIMLDGSPTLFQRPKFRDHTRGRIMEGSLRSDILNVVHDFSTSGSMDDSDDIPQQFVNHVCAIITAVIRY